MDSRGARETPLNAPILCQIRTGCAAGSRLVGTIHTRLNASLEDVRVLLRTLASRVRGDAGGAGEVEVRGAPVNVTREAWATTMSYPLHPFDLTLDFLFVRCGGGVPIRPQQESDLLLMDVFPRLPRQWGVSAAAGWGMEPPPPLVRLVVRPEEYAPTRDALAVVFIAQGRAGSLVTEQVAVERQMLQQGAYGCPYKMEEFSTLLNQWNGNVKDCFGRTVLHDCVYQGIEEAVKYLLSLSFIRVNEKDIQGKTPLHIAVRGGNRSIVSHLLKAGADVLAADIRGDTPLHVALHLRSDRIVYLFCKQLRARGINAKELTARKNNLGMSPLSLFELFSPTFLQLCAEGDVGSIKVLCEHYLFSRDSTKKHDELLHDSALHVAAASGHADVLNFLLNELEALGLTEKHHMLNARDQTPMHLAAEGGHLSAVKLLHERCPWCLSVQDITGATPFVAALRRRKPSMAVVDYFVSAVPRGAAMPNVCDRHGMGALHLLCEFGMVQAASSLIVNHGADVTLSPACNQDDTKRYLKTTRTFTKLSKGFKKKSKDEKAVVPLQGLTPLLCTLRRGRRRLRTIEMLLSHGAGTRGDEVKELLLFLLTNGHYALADRLVASGVTKLIHENDLISGFCRLKHSIGIRWCVEHSCCSINSPNGGGYPLLLSSIAGDAEAVNFFLSCGADPNVSVGKKTPLLAAVEGEYDTIVESLVRGGARVITSDGSCDAPLCAAAKRGSESIIRAFLGLHVFSPLEVSQALVYTMENLYGRKHNNACERVCICLAKSLDLTSSDIINPTELLHLAASRSFFAFIRVLVEKLLLLPTIALCEILRSAPPPPQRLFALIEPTSDSLQAKTTCYVNGKGRKSLYTPPKVFKRLVVVRRRDTGVLFHRLRLRDVFSYCAEANEGELIESLLFDVGLKPWTEPDYRGWNAADYAVSRKRYNVLRMFLLVDLVPLCRHNVRKNQIMVSLCRSMSTAVRVGKNERKLLLSFVLCDLVERREVRLVREILIDACRFHDVPDLSGAGAWLDEFIYYCANTRHLDLLCMLTEEFQIPLKRRLNLSERPLMMMTSVASRDAKLLSFLIRQRFSTDVVDSIPASHYGSSLHSLRSEKRKVSPLWLAARLNDIASMDLLLSTGPLLPDKCVDTEEFCRDALNALVLGASQRPSESQDILIAKGVAMLARAGHMYSLPSVMRDAARKGLLHTVKSLVECYGLRTVAEDIVSDGICSLHHFVSRRELVGVLRSLLLLASDVDPVKVKASQNLLRKIKTTYFEVNPLDYALRKNCMEGAFLLLGIGLCGSGNVMGWWDPKISRIIRLCAARRRTYQEEVIYTVLHAALELQYYEVAKKILGEQSMILPYIEEEEASVEVNHQALHSSNSVPSVTSLMAFYMDKAQRRHLLSLGGAPLPMRISVHDMPYLVFAQSPCEEDYREIVRLSASGGGLEETLSIINGDLNMKIVRRLMSHHRHSFYYDNGSFGLTELTPMGFAVAAGNFPWVQLLTFSNVSTSNNKSVVTRIHRRAAAGGAASRDVKVPALVKKHASEKVEEDTCPVTFTDEHYTVSPLLLSMAIIVETSMSGDTEGLLRQSQIMRFLLSCDQCLHPEEVNPLAIALARLKLWDILEAVVEASKKLVTNPAGDHFFFTIKDVKIPPFVKRAIGSARHVMHVAARCAPREVIVLIAKHSQRADIEDSCDAKGKTVLFHAIHHPHTFALEFLVDLRVPTNRPCCKTTARTPLMIACQRGQLSLVILLLNNSEINSRDHSGNTALILAVAKGHMKVVEHLLANKADTSIKNNNGMTAVMAAAFAGYDDVAAPLAENFCQMDDFFSPQTTLLHCAAVGGCYHVASILIKTVEKTDAFAEDGSGLTALYLAYAFGHPRVLRLLLNSTLQKDMEPFSTTTTTSSSSSSSSDRHLLERQIVACSSALLRYGWLRGTLHVGEALREESHRGAFCQFSPLRPGEKTYACATSFRRFDTSLLLWCARNNNPVGVRVLGDMNAADDCCALHEAAKRGHVDVVKILLSLGMSDANAVDCRGRLPFEVAAVHHHVACAALLLGHTKLDITRLKNPLIGEESKQNAFHRIVAAGAAKVLVMVVEVLEKMTKADLWPAVASQFLELLNDLDSSGMTVFELAVAVGDAAGVVRVAQVVERLAVVSKQENVLTISNTVLLLLPCMPPAVRVLLYDMFGIPEVATCVGFEEGSRTRRLPFADVRLLGVNALKEDELCASKVADVFTLEHEIEVTRSLLKGLPFRIAYNALSLDSKTVMQQVQLLQCLSSSLILSNYENWCKTEGSRGGGTMKLFDTVELEIVPHRAEEFLDLSNRYLRHSVYMDSRRLLTPSLDAQFQLKAKRKAKTLMDETEERCCSLTRTLQKLPHPSLSKGRVMVEWGDRKSEMKVETLERVMNDGLAKVDEFLNGVLKDCLTGVSKENILAVAADSDKITADEVEICFCYTCNSIQKRYYSTSRSKIIILFNDTTIQDATHALRSVLYRRILSDVNRLGVSFARDDFLMNIQRQTGIQMTGRKGVPNFRLDIEESGLDELPLDVFKTMMVDAAEAVASLVSGPSMGTQVFHSSQIVCDFLKRNLRSVLVLFSPKRHPMAEFLDGKLMLCLNLQIAPGKSEIYNGLRSGAVRCEIERLRAELPRVMDTVGQRLQACLPAATLVLDSASLLEGPDDEYIVSALSILCHKDGALVLQRFADSVSIGWDSRLGSVVRKHVLQLTLVPELFGKSTCVLYNSGNLVYNCSLFSMMGGFCAVSSWDILSSEQISSLLLMQLSVVDPTVLDLIDMTKPCPCWSRAYGVCSLLGAGYRYRAVRIAARNILNLRLGKGVSNRTITVRGGWRDVRVVEGTMKVHFTGPTTSGIYKQEILMNGQHILNSPFFFRVRPRELYLPSTKLLSVFDTVIVGRPFEIRLQLRDKYKNKIEKFDKIDVDKTSTESVRIMSWKHSRGVVTVRAVVTEERDECTVPIRLSAADMDGVVLSFTVKSVSKEKYCQFRRLRRGWTLGASDCAKYFFRKSIRDAARRRFTRDAKSVGGLMKSVFPPFPYCRHAKTIMMTMKKKNDKSRMRMSGVWK